MFEEEYRLDFFRRKNFVRKVCASCGSAYWTLDQDRSVCGDTPCTEYSFIGNPVMSRSYTMSEMRSLFLNFFVERGHGLVNPYPVLARWRNDVLLVNASIYDFQPHVTSGDVPPPHNPLTISQPCIRMTDLDQVGRTGKHITSFEMMAHHAFSPAEKPVYWKEETVDYCHELLTSALGVDERSITYKEHPWIGGGNAGPSLEVIVGGLEVATLVFMNLKVDRLGRTELDGEKYSPLALNVVDTGYGLERLVWASQGTSTIYDSVFPGILDRVMERTGTVIDMDSPVVQAVLAEQAALAGTVDTTREGLKIARRKVADRVAKRGVEVRMEEIENILSALEAVHIITDHSKTIALLLSNGAVPSNVKAGYLARLLIRRAMRVMEQRGIDVPLTDFVVQQIVYWRDIMDPSTSDVVKEMMLLEEERYHSTVEKGRGMVKRILEKKSISHEDLVELYDSHGLHHSIVRAVGLELGTDIDVPDNFDSLLASRHQKSDAGAGEIKRYDLPATEKLYYSDPDALAMEAKVIHSEGCEVVLDKTAFYPDGGGQPADHGVLELENRTVPVLDVQKYGDVIVHTLKEPVPVGTNLVGHVDWGRRHGHSQHHSATHVVIGACREVLGKHIWQTGSQNQAEWARIDLSHFRAVTRDEVKRIEVLANDVVWKGLPLDKKEMPREKAEEEYGFQLYQGGAPESKVIRVVAIPGFDTEACGGTHVHRTSDVGFIKITGVEKIQDGVVRITFSAGKSALEYTQNQGDLLQESADALSVPPEQLPKTATRFFEEWKERGKRIDRLERYEALALATEYEKTMEDGVVASVVPGGVDIIALARALVEKPGRTVFFVSDGPGYKCVLARSHDVGTDCKAVLGEVLKGFGKGGGGRPEMAQGGGVSDTASLLEAVKERLC